MRILHISTVRVIGQMLIVTGAGGVGESHSQRLLLNELTEALFGS